jgi:hypothetical protein
MSEENEVEVVTSIQSEEARKAIRDGMFEISASMTRAEGERTYQAEAIKKLHEDYKVDKAILRAMARTFHKSNFATVAQEQEEFQSMYEIIMKESRESVN